MKNSIFYAFKALFVLPITLTFLTASAYSLPGQLKQKNEFIVKVDKTVKADVNSVYSIASIADIPVAESLAMNIHFSYIKPVNDPKPDNTNYQLIRTATLKLHKAIRDC